MWWWKKKKPKLEKSDIVKNLNRYPLGGVGCRYSEEDIIDYENSIGRFLETAVSSPYHNLYIVITLDSEWKICYLDELGYPWVWITEETGRDIEERIDKFRYIIKLKHC